jgi:hypothetical protein
MEKSIVLVIVIVHLRIEHPQPGLDLEGAHPQPGGKAQRDGNITNGNVAVLLLEPQQARGGRE